MTDWDYHPFDDDTGAPIDDRVPSVMVTHEVERDPLPHGYYVGSDYWIWFTTAFDDRKKDVRVCSPISFVGQTRDGQNQHWSLICEVTDRDGNKHLVTVAWTEVFIGEVGIIPLISAGLIVQNKSLFKRLLTLADPQKRARSVRQTGWVQQSSDEWAFLFPDGDVEGAMRIDEKIVYQPDHVMKHAFLTSGTLEEWQEHIAGFAPGNSVLLTSISLASAGPLLKILGKSGVIFHLLGESSIGKTTALHCAGSIWGGGGTNGFVTTWRTTNNAAEGICVLHNDTILLLDELHEADPRQIGNIIYMAANGQGKGRANKNAISRPRLEWSVLGLSSGEGTVAQRMAEANKRETAGQAVRALDIPADAERGLGAWEYLYDHNSPADFSDRLRRASNDFYGTAGREFVRQIASDITHIRSEGLKFISEFVNDICPTDASSQVRRVAEKFAIVAYAGELATRLGITGWDTGNARWGAEIRFKAWFECRGGPDQSEVMDGINRIKSFIECNEDRFVNITAGGATHTVKNCVGYHNTVRKKFMFFRTAFNDEVIGGLNPKTIKSALRDRNLLDVDEGRLAKTVRVGDRTQKLIVVSDKILEL